MAGVSVRTLHHYDQIGLLQPTRNKTNGYRVYDDEAVITLQQILLFREMGFELSQIQNIMQTSEHNVLQALQDQKKLLELKRTRTDTLIDTVEKTIATLTNEHADSHMSMRSVFAGLSQEEIEAHKNEVYKRWGNTPEYRQSQQRTKHWSNKQYHQVAQEYDAIAKELAELMHEEVSHPKVQELIARQHAQISQFYDCSSEMFRALGAMYVDDARFRHTYDTHRSGLAVYMRDAINYYCNQQETT